MSKERSSRPTQKKLINLVVRKTIRASAERLFEAWTKPEQLKMWWGPRNVACTGAELDLRVGGKYRIGNQFPDGKIVWIVGEFERIEPPNKLVYSWRIESEAQDAERITVEFAALGDATEVIVTHERIANATARDQHRQGWNGCLEGLTEYVERSREE